MAQDIQAAIVRWLEAYSESPPTQPGHAEVLVREMLGMEGSVIADLECMLSFNRALEAAKDPIPDVDYIASMLWLALGEPEVSSRAGQSEARLKKAWRAQDPSKAASK